MLQIGGHKNLQETELSRAGALTARLGRSGSNKIGSRRAQLTAQRCNRAAKHRAHLGVKAAVERVDFVAADRGNQFVSGAGVGHLLLHHRERCAALME